MNRYLTLSLLLLLGFYVISLNASFVTAFIFFIFTIVSLVLAVCCELDNKRRRAHLRVVK
ncbi:hypothetical protein [Bacillus benzoevorans]|uniref:Uncharacterized protein n=1 Tax=Bacillus benzoevorans TaxID=1456 RepID=A0A7X0HT86_9BACI|nr:hypothetical protein [Bacillus benzoevorans]MBB6446341.1 hypothetical protein [Bacillus benzoevorans]